MKFPLYSSEVAQMNLLERWIIIHSILYYKYDSNLVADYKYDDNLLQLHDLILSFPESFKLSRYYPTFRKFVGSTGYDLPYRCKRLQPEEYEIIKQEIKRLIYYGKKVWKIL